MIGLSKTLHFSMGVPYRRTFLRFGSLSRIAALGVLVMQDRKPALGLIERETRVMFFKPKRIEPGPGQESVWDYPRPPRLEAVPGTIRVTFAGETIAESDRGMRVLETSHPPVFYFPPADILQGALIPAPGSSFCEFKGAAKYWSLQVNGEVSENAGWSYPNPSARFRDLADCVAFYASRVDACWVGDEKVIAQEGDFYGGWITSKVVGPFKGPPGTRGW